MHGGAADRSGLIAVGDEVMMILVMMVMMVIVKTSMLVILVILDSLRLEMK